MAQEISWWVTILRYVGVTHWFRLFLADPANLIILLVACGTIFYGSRRSLDILTLFQESSQEIGTRMLGPFVYSTINLISIKLFWLLSHHTSLHWHYSREKFHEIMDSYSIACGGKHCIDSALLLPSLALLSSSGVYVLRIPQCSGIPLLSLHQDAIDQIELEQIHRVRSCSIEFLGFPFRCDPLQGALDWNCQREWSGQLVGISGFARFVALNLQLCAYRQLNM